MQAQRQTHQLKPTWEAEDYANQAEAAAQVSQRYHHLITERVSAVNAELDGLRQRFDISDRENRQLRAEMKRLDDQTSARNPAILWGIGSAIVTALVINLILTPSQSLPPVQSQKTFHLGG